MIAWHPPHVPEAWREPLKWAAWIVAGVWSWRASECVQRIGTVADLTDLRWQIGPARLPSLAVIVPAKDEEPHLPATLDALMAQEYPYLRVVVVDDRSEDQTGYIAEEYAERFPGRVQALHVSELPEAWLGKTWALEVATERCRDADYLLFTDADVRLSPSILWRALGYAELAEADHLVVFPTPELRHWREGVVMGFFQVLALWASRPWRVSDPRARRDTAGVGAFNLVRRDAFEELGGWFPQRYVVLEDVTLGLRMKAAGMRQRVVFARGQVLVHWARGLRGLVRVMTKNLFSTVNFQPLLMLAACGWIVLFFLAPLLGFAWVGTLVPALIIAACIAACYRSLEVMTGIPPRYGWGYPLGALALAWAMLRSMLVVSVRRGVMWRGTFYPLGELRQHNSPFQWERQARDLREQERRVKPSGLRRWVDSWKRRG